MFYRFHNVNYTLYCILFCLYRPHCLFLFFAVMTVCYDWIEGGADHEQFRRTLTVSDENQFRRFIHLLSCHIRVQVFDEYLWGSRLTRQMPSKFTRVQRLSCCAAILCLAMISNAMFYDTEDKVQATESIQISSQLFSFGTIYVALISSLVTLPASITMITLFKKAGRDIQVTPSINLQISETHDSYPHHSSLSRCFGILAWMIVFASSFVSTFFLVLYSLEWGPTKSKQWLMTELTSFFLSAALVDPTKVNHHLTQC